MTTPPGLSRRLASRTLRESAAGLDPRIDQIGCDHVERLARRQQEVPGVVDARSCGRCPRRDRCSRRSAMTRRGDEYCLRDGHPLDARASRLRPVTPAPNPITRHAGAGIRWKNDRAAAEGACLGVDLTSRRCGRSTPSAARVPRLTRAGPHHGSERVRPAHVAAWRPYATSRRETATRFAPARRRRPAPCAIDATTGGAFRRTNERQDGEQRGDRHHDERPLQPLTAGRGHDRARRERTGHRAGRAAERRPTAGWTRSMKRGHQRERESAPTARRPAARPDRANRSSYSVMSVGVDRRTDRPHRNASLSRNAAQARRPRSIAGTIRGRAHDAARSLRLHRAAHPETDKEHRENQREHTRCRRTAARAGVQTASYGERRGARERHDGVDANGTRTSPCAGTGGTSRSIGGRH